MIRYRVEAHKGRVVPVRCEVAGHPHPDADGQTQYENVHFDHEADALASLVRNVEAGLALVADSYRSARREVCRQRRRLARQALLVDRARVLATAPVGVCEACGARTRTTKRVRAAAPEAACVACHGTLRWETP